MSNTEVKILRLK